MAKVATDFEKIINDGRERKRNEQLAQRIFSKDRRQSEPPSTRLPGTGPSLASRVGVKKRVASSSQGPSTRNTIPAGNVDGEWTHDLHASVNDKASNSSSLAARISAPGAPKRGGLTSSGKPQQQRAARLAAALERTEAQQQQQTNLPLGIKSKGLSIRGLAGPFAVMAQNFAPGTTAADIESAMTPVGGEMLSCVVLKTSPLMVVEMVFASKDGAEAVISTFNDQTADGRIIKVYPKPGGYQAPAAASSQRTAPLDAPTGPRATRSAKTQVIDGSHGFADLMDEDEPRAVGANNSGGSGLYSDKLVGGRRGRGFNRGAGNRGGR